MSNGKTPIPVAVDPVTGALIVEGGGSGGGGGTSSTFGATFPITGTAVGATNGTNMEPLTVDGSGNLLVNVAAGGTSGTQYTDGSAAVTHPIGTIPVFNNAGTITAVSAANPLPVSGSFTPPALQNVNVTQIGGNAVTTTVPVSGTVAATESGTWTVGSNSATAATAPSNAFFVGGQDGSGNLQGIRALSPADANGNTVSLISAARGQVYNGSTWDLTREAINGTNSTGTGITAVANIAQFDDVSPTSITENQFGNLRMSANRNLYGTIRDAAGNERGANVTSANALVVDGSAVTQPVSGTVTANAGTGTMNVSVQNTTLAVTESGTWNVGLNAGSNAIGSITNTSFIATQSTASNLNATVVQGTAAAVTAGWPVIGGEMADTTGTFTNATQTNSVTTTNFDGYSAIIVSISGTYGTATGVFEESDDGGTTWYSVNAARSDGSAVETGYTTLTNTNRMWTMSVSGADQFRVRSTAVASGTVNVRISVESMPTPEAATVTAYQSTAANLNATVRLQDGSGTNLTSTNGSLNVVQQAGTGTLTNVSGSASSVTLLASNSLRKGAEITNDSSALLYLKFGSTASTSSYTVVMAGAAAAPFSYYEVPAGYTGIITGIWASATGNARVTEVT